MNETELFEPDRYADVRRPLLEASSMPPWCYTDETFYRREVERVLLPGWNLACRADEIPAAGDYRVFDFCGRSAIVVRGDDGVVRAFANICRHRGTRLLDDAGHVRAMICPYHAWTYRLDGSLFGCRGMEKTAGFEKSANGLLPVRHGEWAGFVFVCFDAAAPPLEQWLGSIVGEFAPYRFEEFRVVRRKEYDLACNWKLYIENAMEDYHTPTVHRTSIGLQETVPIDTVGEWESIHMEGSATIGILADDSTPFPHVDGLSGRPARGSAFTVLYPTTFFGTTFDCMWWLQTLPLGPRRCRVIQGSCFPASTVARDDFQQHVTKYYRRWDKSIPEDNAISERQQAGLELAEALPGRLSVHEPVVHSMANWVLDRVLAPA